jgi:hypothetical protein
VRQLEGGGQRPPAAEAARMRLERACLAAEAAEMKEREAEGQEAKELEEASLVTEASFLSTASKGEE